LDALLEEGMEFEDKDAWKALKDREFWLNCQMALAPDEIRYLQMRFGLDGERERTLRELAKLLGKSHVSLWRYEQAILQKLRRLWGVNNNGR